MSDSCNSREAPRCGYCGRERRGFAQVGEVVVCHPSFPVDIDDDCYRAVTVYHRPLLDGRVWPW